LSANSGISYYGIFAETFVPFEVSLLGGAAFTWLCALHVTGTDVRPVRNTLFAIAIFTCVVAATPYSYDNVLSAIHRLAGSFLFTLQLLLSFWLIAKLHHALWSVLLTTAELIAGIACALYLYPTHGFLIQSQVLFQFFFSLLLIFSLRQLPLRHVVKANAV
jgi:hypothetical protein